MTLKSTALRIYLAFLCVVEIVSLCRLLIGEQTSVVTPFILSQTEDLFKGLYASYITLLLVTRACVLQAEDFQVDVWRFCAAVHVVEALWLIPVAYTQRALPTSWASIRGRQMEALVLVSFVAANALGFLCIFLSISGSKNTNKRNVE